MVPQNSKLKELEVENCGIEKIHESFFRPRIQLNLKNNQIKELPKDEFLRFLQSGGGLEYVYEYGKEDPCIDVHLNPLEYPPDFVIKRGKKEIISYLTKYSNTLVNDSDTPVIILGDSGAGKTTLSLMLTGEIASADEVKEADRTQAFDLRETLLKGIQKV